MAKNPKTPDLQDIAKMLTEQNKAQQTMLAKMEREREDLVSRLANLERVGALLEQGALPSSRQARLMRREAVLEFDGAKGTTPGRDAGRLTLSERLEAALRERPRTIRELAMHLNERGEKITPLLQELKEQEKVCNVGVAEVPAWFWRIGEKATVDELREAILRLLTWRPLFHSEIISATGAGEKRVTNELHTLFNRWHAVQNLGSPKKRLYWRANLSDDQDEQSEQSEQSE
jgi:hypothetical protein